MIPKVNVKEVNKYPLAVVVAIVVSLLWWALPRLIESKDQSLMIYKDRNEKLNNTNAQLKKSSAQKDSIISKNNSDNDIENKFLKRQNDSLRNVIIDAKTEGLERVIKIISDGRTSLVIKPKKK